MAEPDVGPVHRALCTVPEGTDIAFLGHFEKKQVSML